MSGPKESHWRLRQRQREEIREQRAKERARQVSEIKIGIDECHDQLQRIHSEHGHYADYLTSRIENWLEDVLTNCDFDLRQAWRGLKGTTQYLATQKEKLQEKAGSARQRQLAREERMRNKQMHQQALTIEASEHLHTSRTRLENLQEELGEDALLLLGKPHDWLENAEQQLLNNPERVIHTIKGVNSYLDSHNEDFNGIRHTQLAREKVERITANLNAVREDFQEIMNTGIEQRIAVFSKSIRTNPDNPNTIKQIETFKMQLRNTLEEQQEKQAQLAHVQHAFSEALGAEANDGDDGSVVIAGEVEGVPIRVTINSKNNGIHFDTPTDGSCRNAMDTLVNNLQEEGIGLGPIRLLNTGETINDKATNTAKPTIRA